MHHWTRHLSCDPIWLAKKNVRFVVNKIWFISLRDQSRANGEGKDHLFGFNSEGKDNCISFVARSPGNFWFMSQNIYIPLIIVRCTLKMSICRFDKSARTLDGLRWILYSLYNIIPLRTLSLSLHIFSLFLFTKQIRLILWVFFN